MTTDERLREIRERAESATRMPWEADRSDDNGMWSVLGGGERIANIIPWSDVADKADAEFIAHAREDVPWLLAELEKARKALRDIADDNHDGPHEEWYEGGCDGAMMEHAKHALK